MPRYRTIGWAGLAAALVVLASGCGNGDTEPQARPRFRSPATAMTIRSASLDIPTASRSGCW
jgi:hypothetical protein